MAKGLSRPKKKCRTDIKTAIQNIFAKLDSLKERYAQSKAGHRDEIYRCMKGGQLIILELLSREKLLRRFTLRVNKNKRSQDRARFSLSTEVMGMIMGAESRGARQLASKRGQVLDYLREDGVKVEATVREIRSRGGISKILRDAASNRASPPTLHKGHDVLPKHRSSTKSATLASPIKSNNQEVIVPVWMRLSDRDEIFESVLGSRIKLFALRVGQKQADIKITGVKFRSDDGNKDWA